MSKNVAVCFETDISGFRQAFFNVLKRLVLGTALEDFKMHQGVISGEGVSPSLSPRRLRAKYTLRTNPRFMLRGISPCRGQICVSANFPLPPQRTGAWIVLLLKATFQCKCAATPEGLCRSTSAAARATAISRPDTDIRLTKKRRRISRHGKGKSIYEKKFIYRDGEAA